MSVDEQFEVAVERAAGALRDHGAETYPDDEFDCCARAALDAAGLREALAEVERLRERVSVLHAARRHAESAQEAAERQVADLQGVIKAAELYRDIDREEIGRLKSVLAVVVDVDEIAAVLNDHIAIDTSLIARQRCICGWTPDRERPFGRQFRRHQAEAVVAHLRGDRP